MSVSLDSERLRAICQLLSEWEQRVTCSLRQLQATIGTLQWAAQVVHPGRTFLQHLRDLAAQHATSLPHDTGAITITADAREDLRWWSTFTAQWNPSRYSSHSFRKGGAVSLQAQGVEDSLIRRSGRWRSDAFHLYVRHTPIDVLVATNARL